MATPQKIVHGSWTEPWAGLAVLSLFGLGLAQAWEFAFVAVNHGGLAFVLAWLLCMALLALPLRLAEVMLGRRSRRAPVEGLAYLTREADVPRWWRAASWSSLLAAVLGMAGLALLGGWAVSFLGHRLVSPEIYTATYAGVVWPLGTGSVILLAAGLAWLGLQRLAPVYLGLLILVGGLLLPAAVLGMGEAGPLVAFKGAELGLAGWLEAARFALLSLGGGLGLVWLAGAYLPAAKGPASLALPALGLQIVLTLLVALAVMPFVLVANTLPGDSVLMQRLPAAMTSTDIRPWLVFGALALASLAALAALGEVVMRFLQERGLPLLPALVLSFALAALIAEGLWLLAAAQGAENLLRGLRLLLLLVLLGWSLFAGWQMKISHARKEFNFSSELVYNLWRVAVRLLCPLAIVAVLVGSLL